jgi:hypothetical protein
MTDPQMLILNAFLNGVIAMGHATAGLFFMRFWKKTGDRLFVLFGIAFMLLGLVRLFFLSPTEPYQEHYAYWLRLFAYLIILAAIVDKNWRR